MDAVTDLVRAVAPGTPVALVTAWGWLAVASPAARAAVPADPATAATVLRRLDAAAGPRWVWWSAATTATTLLAADPGLRLRRCWDLAAVHRLLHGGRDDDPPLVWAGATGLPAQGMPRAGQLDLLSVGASGDDGDVEDPVRPDGYLRTDWCTATGERPVWAHSAQRAARWASVALDVRLRQADALVASPAADLGPSGDRVHTAWSESAAALLAVELEAHGLPLDVAVAERVVEGFIGPRPRDQQDADRLRAERDTRVLAHAPGHGGVDLRSPAQVRTLLADLGLDLPDTRSWRLERFRRAHPLVGALLTWRQQERFLTTYGYRWLDEHVHADGRLRGRWTGSDGGAGRMTAQAGLHSLPHELRVAVRAEPGTTFVRADLGQVEPRVLAAVSGDPALAAAAREEDLYAPVALRLGCDRAVAKVAVLAAMYGQTSGVAGEALRGMRESFPVAMAYLDDAHARGLAGEDVRTYGGRWVRGWAVPAVGPEAGPAAYRAHQAALQARGRFTRNAVVQGAAAELFKAWTATVRARLAADGSGVIVLCLHDELVLQVAGDRAQEVAAGVVDDLTATAARWLGGNPPVRFVAEVEVSRSWGGA